MKPDLDLIRLSTHSNQSNSYPDSTDVINTSSPKIVRKHGHSPVEKVESRSKLIKKLQQKV